MSSSPVANAAMQRLGDARGGIDMRVPRGSISFCPAGGLSQSGGPSLATGTRSRGLCTRDLEDIRALLRANRGTLEMAAVEVILFVRISDDE
jgi:hypothetical protein